MTKPPRSSESRPLAQLALIFVAHVVAFVVVYAVSVRTVTGRELADASLRGAISARPLLRSTVQTILDVVSVASLLGAVAVVAIMALVRLARLEGHSRLLRCPRLGLRDASAVALGRCHHRRRILSLHRAGQHARRVASRGGRGRGIPGGRCLDDSA